ncbi:hypothetical protein RR46_00602 [Papilio xuthus]|uniref:Ig-like domain-containing protein n=1 Tax=Papilio xuthus TaxID=66420 RepID=A0A0N0PAE3_PAPXU|nr:hypothetical protein RR46_00602 [Papilio xuthus]
MADRDVFICKKVWCQKPTVNLCCVLFNDILFGSVKTETLPNGALSRLYIANANRQDSGNYTCSLADFAATAVSVHVLRGENPLAMQRGGVSNVTHSLRALLISYIS